MTLKRSSVPALIVLAALTPLLMGSSDLREDQFECEQAVSHMVGCCPASFDPTKVDCEYTVGCGANGTYYPRLSVTDSKCIENETCDSILASGQCDAVENLSTSTSTPGSNPPVCSK